MCIRCDQLLNADKRSHLYYQDLPAEIPGYICAMHCGRTNSMIRVGE